MPRAASVPILVAGVLALAFLPVLVGGCNSSDGDDGPQGGSISGRMYDAVSGLGLGGVTVEIVTVNGVVSASSVAPSGNFVLSGLPAGTYNTIHVIPDPNVFGAGSDFYVNINVTVSPGSSYDLPGNILVVDGMPPDPA